LVKYFFLTKGAFLRFRIKKFYNSGKDFQQFYCGLKQIACPHCKLIGSLILHGYLSGYDELVYGRKIIRGRRIFCSNRNRRNGCGKTFSILKSNIIKGFNITANSLWGFLNYISNGINKFESFKYINLSFSNTTIYRLFRRFKYQQTKIRTTLSRMHLKPKTFSNKNPVVQTILHLNLAFNHHPCPISAYQEHFQEAFL